MPLVHPKFPERGQSVEGNRALKQRLVYEGQAHASVVYDGDRAVGWCQYGIPEELPTISHRKEYEAGLVEHADYRLTCFFVDRDYRRDGVSTVALRGALDLIAAGGGGIVRGTLEISKKRRRSRPRSSTTAPEASSNRQASSTSDPRARTTV